MIVCVHEIYESDCGVKAQVSFIDTDKFNLQDDTEKYCLDKIKEALSDPSKCAAIEYDNFPIQLSSTNSSYFVEPPCMVQEFITLYEI